MKSKIVDGITYYPRTAKEGRLLRPKKALLMPYLRATSTCVVKCLKKKGKLAGYDIHVGTFLPTMHLVQLFKKANPL